MKIHLLSLSLLWFIDGVPAADDGLADSSSPRGRKLLIHTPTPMFSGEFSVATTQMAFVLCCALLCSCFYAKRKQINEQKTDQVVEPEQLDDGSIAVDSVSSLEVSSRSGKVPRSPLRAPYSPLRTPPDHSFRIPPSPSRFSMSPQLSRSKSVHLSMSQIIKATRNFSSSYLIGRGGFGSVYKAELPDHQVVAVKRGRKEDFSTLQTEFSNEVELLSKLEHRSLVKMLGCISKGNERIIITEYVSNGTLREHLDGERGTILDFNQRLEISIDVAHALTYLHVYAERKIIHRDVKSSNILLTDNFKAKVTDFGFAKTGDENKSQVFTSVKGTAGYVDPEYLKTNQLTPKSDVFSFGVLLIEIMSGRRPVEMKRTAEEKITLRWAFKKHVDGNMMEILDPLLEEELDEEIVDKMFSLAFQCAAPTRHERPSMNDVVGKLWEIRKLYMVLKR